MFERIPIQFFSFFRLPNESRKFQEFTLPEPNKDPIEYLHRIYQYIKCFYMLLNMSNSYKLTILDWG